MEKGHQILLKDNLIDEESLKKAEKEKQTVQEKVTTLGK